MILLTAMSCIGFFTIFDKTISFIRRVFALPLKLLGIGYVYDERTLRIAGEWTVPPEVVEKVMARYNGMWPEAYLCIKRDEFLKTHGYDVWYKDRLPIILEGLYTGDVSIFAKTRQRAE